MARRLATTATTFGLIGAALLATAGPAQADVPPGCSVSPPDAHIVSGRKVDVDFLFRCDNPRIRYVKVTLNIRRDRSGWSDPAVTTYQFDNFRDPTHAGVNSSLQTDGACERGKRYHGDITVNVMLNADQTFTETRRGPSVSCA